MSKAIKTRELLAVFEQELNMYSCHTEELKKLAKTSFDELKELEQSKKLLDALKLADKNGYNYEYDEENDIWLIHSCQDGYEDILIWFEELQKEGI